MRCCAEDEIDKVLILASKKDWLRWEWERGKRGTTLPFVVVIEIPQHVTISLFLSIFLPFFLSFFAFRYGRSFTNTPRATLDPSNSNSWSHHFLWSLSLSPSVFFLSFSFSPYVFLSSFLLFSPSVFLSSFLLFSLSFLSSLYRLSYPSPFPPLPPPL